MSRKKIPNVEKVTRSAFDGESLTARIRELVGTEWGDEGRYAEKVSVPQATLNRYLNGRVPPIEFLWIVAQKEGLSIDWLLTGKGPKFLPQEPGKKKRPATRQARRIPILGKIPAGPPGGQRWSEYDAANLLDDLTGIQDQDIIALKVHGDSMFPTLFDGDLVVMTPHGTPANGDLVVAEIQGSGQDYQVKRLGQATRQETTLISDNFLHFPPMSYPAGQAHIRGRVIRVIRTPSRRSPHRHGNEGLMEFYQNETIQKIIERLPELGTRDQEAVIAVIETLWKSRGKEG